MIIVIKMGRLLKNSIDSEQSNSIEKHFDRIMSDDTLIKSDILKITCDDLPDWFDEQLFKEGQAYYKRNILGITITYLLSLIAVFIIPSIADILMFTKQSSTPCTAFTRYFRTLLYMYDLHCHDPVDSNSKMYDSVNTIRRKHAVASGWALKSGKSGIYQRDMVLTQSCLVGYALMHPEFMSLTNTPEERKGFLHFWRVMGHLLGIPDGLNVCRRNEHETLLLCQKIKDEVYSVHLRDPSADFFHLAYVTVVGVQSVIPPIDTDMILILFYKIHKIQYNKPIGYKTVWHLNLMKSISYVIGLPIIGSAVRAFFNMLLKSHFWFHQRHPVFAQMKYGKDQTKIKMYPYSNFK